MTATESDDALMARVALRDGDALRLLADRYAEISWRIAYRMLADPTEAEDVAQEAMLRLWQYADRWQAGGSGVAACIEALPDRQRAAVILTYYEEQQNKMAAEVLAMQVKAFESLLFRARASLRACVEDKGVRA